MTDEQIEQLLEQNRNENFVEFYSPKAELRYEQLKGGNILNYINRLKEEKYQLEQNLGQCENGYKLELHTTRMLQQRAETQPKELLSALYQRTIKENGCFVVFRKDIVELAKDYGIKEEELNGKIH